MCCPSLSNFYEMMDLLYDNDCYIIMTVLQQAYVEALYHAHFDRWDYRRLTYTWWSSLVNDVATSHRIDVLLDRHPLPVATHPYMHMQLTEQEKDKIDQTLPSSPTRPTGRVDNPEDVLVPFSRPMVPFSCSTTDSDHSSTSRCGVGTHHTPRRSCAINPTTGHSSPLVFDVFSVHSCPFLLMIFLQYDRQIDTLF